MCWPWQRCGPAQPHSAELGADAPSMCILRYCMCMQSVCSRHAVCIGVLRCAYRARHTHMQERQATCMPAHMLTCTVHSVLTSVSAAHRQLRSSCSEHPCAGFCCDTCVFLHCTCLSFFRAFGVASGGSAFSNALQCSTMLRVRW